MIRTWSNTGTRLIRARRPPGRVRGSGAAEPIVGAGAMSFVSNTVDQVAALPPGMLLLLAVVTLAGLYFLRRAL